MITLYKFGPAFGLPDPSPFVVKVEMLLKMANLLHRTDATGLAQALKGKIPCIEDEGVVIQDSTFIRWHIEKKYRIDFDHGLNASQKATAWAFEKMAEHQLRWVGMYDRSMMMNEDSRKSPLGVLRNVPAPLRPILAAVIRRRLGANLHSQDLGQFSPDEVIALATRSINSIADFLGDKPFFMGSEPTGADATIFAFVCMALCPYFELRIRGAAERRENLRRYVGRMAARYYPGLKHLAGCKAAA